MTWLWNDLTYTILINVQPEIVFIITKQKLAIALFRQIIERQWHDTNYYTLLCFVAEVSAMSYIWWFHGKLVAWRRRVTTACGTHHIRESFSETAEEEYNISHYYKSQLQNRLLFLNQPLHTIKYMSNDYVLISTNDLHYLFY